MLQMEAQCLAWYLVCNSHKVSILSTNSRTSSAETAY